MNCRELITFLETEVPLETAEGWDNPGFLVGDKDKVSVTYKNLYKDIKVGAKVLIDDGAIELVVDAIEGKDIVCTVVHGNGLGSRKTINLPGTPVRLRSFFQRSTNARVMISFRRNY